MLDRQLKRCQAGRVSLPFACLCVLPSVSESVSQSVSQSYMKTSTEWQWQRTAGLLAFYINTIAMLRVKLQKSLRKKERERGEDEDDDRTCCKHVSYGCGKLLYLSIYRDNVTRNCAAITVKRMQKFKYSRAREDNWGRTSNETSREI